MLDSFRADVRQTLRSLAQRPTFAATAIMTIAIGIGASTAIFSVTSRTLPVGS
jgi:putative ABC transport system permease protein